MKLDLYSVEYFDAINKDEEQQAENLCSAIMKLYNPEQVIDIGCATGLYMAPYLDRKVYVEGIDGSENALHPSVIKVPRMMITQGDIREMEQHHVKQFDVAVCLEVLEHIPEEYADRVVEIVSSRANILVLSAARPGQPGEHHHNCQLKEYWIEKFSKYGYLYDEVDTQLIHTELEKGHHTNWIDNIFVLKQI